MTPSPEQSNEAVRGVHYPVPGFAARRAVETLADAEIKLSQGPGQSRAVRFVVHDNHGWAEIRIDPDGSIDAVHWGQH